MAIVHDVHDTIGHIPEREGVVVSDPRGIFSRRFLQPLALLVFACAIFACQSVPPSAKPSLRDSQISELHSLGFVENGDGWQLGIADPILFEVEQVELKPRTRDLLAAMSHRLLSVNIHELRIEGHTDTFGTREYNDELSLRRAQAVADVFIANGFAKGKVICHGLAWDFPLQPNTTREGRAKNRRVEVIVAASGLAPSDD
jgi:outer membrane protein OmpA-like peptidoglycan-associated protein